MPARDPGRADVVLAFVGVAAISTLVELLARSGEAATLLTGLGAAVALGLLHGLVWHVVLHLPARYPARWASAVPWVAAVGVAAWLALELGAFARLGSRNHALAMVAMAASAGAGILVYVAAWGLSPRSAARSRLLDAPPRIRTLVAVLLVVGSIIASWLDRTQFPGLHPAAHSALRAASLAAIAFVAMLRWPSPLRPPLDVIALIAALAVAALPFATLSDGAGGNLRALFETPLSDEGVRVLRRLTDVDGDGHSAWLGGGDCAPFDPAIHPGAVEIAGNGIDDDCAGGDAPARVVDLDAVAVPTSPSPRSVLLITVETLRADHLGLYGYPRETTPELDRWSTRARVFDRAFTAGAWTSIAIPTLLRGVNARRLSWRPFAETDRGRLIAKGDTLELDEGERGVQTFLLPDGGVPPLPWWLKRRGMTTAAVVDDRFSELLDPSVGTDWGFDTFVDADVIRGRDPDDEVVDLAIDTLRGLPDDRPFFLWVHLFGPHSPNTTHEGVPTFGDGLVDGYDHEIRFVDAQIGRLLDAATIRDPSLVWVVTADHGEVLLDGDRMHGFDLSLPVIRVPLLVGGAGLAPGREPGLVSTLDLFPTIMAVTETPAPSYVDGIDLTRGPPPGDRLVLVDTWHRGFDGSVLFDQAGITDGRYELVLERTKNTWYLLDLHAPERTPQEIGPAVDTASWTARLRQYVGSPALDTR